VTAARKQARHARTPFAVDCSIPTRPQQPPEAGLSSRPQLRERSLERDRGQIQGVIFVPAD
jgi:hypothetical protein